MFFHYNVFYKFRMFPYNQICYVYNNHENFHLNFSTLSSNTGLKNLRILFLNIFLNLLLPFAHVSCTAIRAMYRNTYVMYRNTCHVPQHVSCTAAIRVMYCNTCHVPQHVPCTAAQVSCTATVFKCVILFLPSLFQFC